VYSFDLVATDGCPYGPLQTIVHIVVTVNSAGGGGGGGGAGGLNSSLVCTLLQSKL